MAGVMCSTNSFRTVGFVKTAAAWLIEGEKAKLQVKVERPDFAPVQKLGRWRSMKQERIEVIYICDLCGQECEPVREIRLLHSFAGDGRNEIRLKVSANVYYVAEDGDVCNDCLMTALRTFVMRNGGDS